MIINGKEYKTPEEWAMPLEEAGLTIRTYDGFFEIYENLKNTRSMDKGVHNYIMARTVDIPEQVICTREAFDKAMSGNGISYSRNVDYILLADTIPNYAEHLLSNALYSYNLLLNEILKTGDVNPDCLDTKETAILKTIKKLEDFKDVSEKNKTINNVTEERSLSELTDIIESYIFKAYPIAVEAKKRNETVESLQMRLVDELINKLQKVSQGEDSITQDIIDKIDIVHRLTTCTQRYHKMLDFDLIEECDINPNYGDVEQEMKIETYRIINNKVVHNYVAGKQNGVTITMETDSKLYNKAKQRKAKKQKEKKAIPVTYSIEDVTSVAAIECTTEDITDARKSIDDPTKTKGGQDIDE